MSDKPSGPTPRYMVGERPPVTAAYYTEPSMEDTNVGTKRWECLVRDDAVSFLSRFPNESFDLFVTDPPYESLEKHRKVGTTTRLKVSKSSSNPWFGIFPNSRFPELLAQLYRTLKNNRHLYLFCDQETMFVLAPIAVAAGFKFWKPLVWDKVNIGMGYHYRCRYEFILFFEKGKRKLRDLSVPDVLTEKRITDGYPTEKPVGILRTLIEQSSEAGETVCDPFCGSGSTGVAAWQTGRRFYGADAAADAIALTAANIRAAVAK